MTFSIRRRNESLLKRLWYAWKFVPERDGICSSDDFQMELAKEVSRSNRRRQDREFALVHLSSDGSRGQFSPTDALVDAFHQRLRISDVLGWHSSNLAVLLPETGRDGATLVAEDLVKLGAKYGTRMDSKVYVYPWDDELISVSNEIANLQEHCAGDGGNDRVGGNGFADGFERQDVAHPAFFQSNPNEVPQDFNQNGSGNDRSRASGHLRLAAPAESVSKLGGLAETEMAEGNVAVMTDARIGQDAQKALLAPRVRATSKHLNRSMMMIETISTPWWKRTIDILGAGVGLIVLSPILIGAAVAIKITSPGPVLFRQRREGKGGKQFDILKFRTMVVDAESKQASLRKVSEQDGPAFKLKDDPRITLIGRTLRKSCIDELPQLVNVLVGEMSLVGPRPLPVSESTECTPWQRVRLTVLPGLTCTWQARGGRQVSFDQWMRMDLDYIENRSFKNDMRLIFETALIAVMQRGSV